MAVHRKKLDLLTSAKMRPIELTHAPAKASPGRGKPAPISNPPIHAPPALPKLNAAMLSADDRLGAPSAACIMPIWSGGMVPKAAMPIRKMVIVAGINDAIVTENSAISTIKAASTPIRAKESDLSAQCPMK